MITDTKPIELLIQQLSEQTEQSKTVTRDPSEGFKCIHSKTESETNILLVPI